MVSIPLNESNLAQYASLYLPKLKIKRLESVAKLAFKPLSSLAATLLLNETLKANDVASYLNAASVFTAVTDSKYAVDDKWCAETRVRNRSKHDILDREASSALISESRRLSHVAFAKHFYDVGDFAECLKNIQKAKSLSNSYQVIDLTLFAATVYLELEQYLSITAALHGIESTYVSQENALKILILESLVFLNAKDYRSVIANLLSIPFATEFSPADSILTKEDIACYILVLSLAVFSIDEMKLLMSNREAMQYFDLIPQISNILKCLTSRNYGEFLNLLNDTIYPYLSVDLYFYHHLDRLKQDILSQAIILFLKPFSSIHMDRLTRAIGLSEKEMEDMLLSLIYNGPLSQYRIDSANKILFRILGQDSNSSLSSLQHLCDDQQFYLQSTLLKLSYLRQKAEFKSDKTSIFDQAGNIGFDHT